MLDLTRTVRFCLNGPDPARGEAGEPADPSNPIDPAARNGYAGYPPMRGLGRYYELHVRCRGEADAVTGYFMNIREIDQAVRRHVLPDLEALLDTTRPSSVIAMGALMRRMLDLLRPALRGTVVEVALQLTPFHSLTILEPDMATILIRQRYEFAAAHRLHVPTFSDERNREVFGKCNNPSGHGHNYEVEVAVRAPIDAQGRIVRVEELDRVVLREAIDKLDHKHLNVDVPQFAKLNPSVENIAKVVYEMLAAPVEALGVTLEEISVWETGKTRCTYRGQPVAALS